MIGPPSHIAIGAACVMLGVGLAELWMDTVGLGGATGVFDLGAFVDGRKEISELEYDILAQALNERFMDGGDDHPIPYASQL